MNLLVSYAFNISEFYLIIQIYLPKTHVDLLFLEITQDNDYQTQLVTVP